MHWWFVVADEALKARWLEAVSGAEIVSDLAELGEEARWVLLDASLLGTGLLMPERLAELTQNRRLVLADPLHQQERGLTALASGCAGYCHAYTEPDALRQILEVVASGEVWVGRELLSRLLGGLNANLPAPSEAWREPLTEREQAVAECAAQGLVNKEIASRLDITVRTVKAHLSSVFAKLGVRDRVQLALRLRA
ncbi:MAG: response regulator transcription factor [Gammaproteobacteria bacterium]|nr:response regulator transcription factor [Gammaproteobacteria bacterium]